eukprot:9452124-Alexandrium_andersonii.AAC.1
MVCTKPDADSFLPARRQAPTPALSVGYLALPASRGSACSAFFPPISQVRSTNSRPSPAKI